MGGGGFFIFFSEKQFFLISFHILCYFLHFKKQDFLGNIEERFPGVGVVSNKYFFFRKTILSRFMLFPTFDKKSFLRNIKKCPIHLLINWLNGRWFIQIVDREF